MTKDLTIKAHDGLVILDARPRLVLGAGDVYIAMTFTQVLELLETAAGWVESVHDSGREETLH